MENNNILITDDAANGKLNDGKDATTNNASVCGYDSLHQLLAANLKPHIFQVVFSSFSSLIEFLCGNRTEVWKIFNDLFVDVDYCFCSFLLVLFDSELLGGEFCESGNLFLIYLRDV